MVLPFVSINVSTTAVGTDTYLSADMFDYVSISHSKLLETFHIQNQLSKLGSRPSLLCSCNFSLIRCLSCYLTHTKDVLMCFIYSPLSIVNILFWYALPKLATNWGYIIQKCCLLKNAVSCLISNNLSIIHHIQTRDMFWLLYKFRWNQQRKYYRENKKF